MDGEKNDRMAFQARADCQNQAIGWLQRGYSSLGGGTVVRFPRIWMAPGECRINTRARTPDAAPLQHVCTHSYGRHTQFLKPDPV